MPWGTCISILIFLRFFRFSVTIPYRTDRRTARRVMRLIGRLHNKAKFDERILFTARTRATTAKLASRNRLKVFEMACLRKIEGVSRRDRIRNTEIQNRLNWQKDKQTNSAEMVKVLWSYCQNEHTKIPIRGTAWTRARNKEAGQTKEKID